MTPEQFLQFLKSYQMLFTFLQQVKKERERKKKGHPKIFVKPNVCLVGEMRLDEKE